jgi:hypothetical protein
VRSTRKTLVAAAALIASPILAAAGQSSVAVSPYVALIPSATSNPLAGFSLAFGGTTGLALRSGAHLSINNPEPTGTQGVYRPWGADADGMLFLNGLGGGATVWERPLAPYVFAGVGLTGGDSAGANVVQHSWSYGVGANLALGRDVDIISEARWRLHQYMLPTAKNAPDSKSEFRFGLSFHVGSDPDRRRPEPRRRRERDYYDDEYAVTRAPAVAPQPTVIVQQAPAPPPQTVIVQQAPPQTIIVQQPEPEPSTTVNVNLPGAVVVNQGGHVHTSRSSRSSRRSSQRVYVANPVTVVRAQPQRATAARTQVIEVRPQAQPVQVQPVKVVKPRERSPE